MLACFTTAHKLQVGEYLANLLVCHSPRTAKLWASEAADFLSAFVS